MALLSEDEVRSIFRYIHDEESECELDFKIIQSRTDTCGVGTLTSALKDGIYLLCDTQREDFPSHLRDIVVINPPTEGNAFAWKGSGGPLTNESFDLNRRSTYSYTHPWTAALGSKRGSLWNMVENDLEKTQYRIFHVQDRMRHYEEEEDENGCRECGKNDKPDLQLQCSGCLIVYCHVECAGLPDVPEGDWFCSGKCERAGAVSDDETGGEPEDADYEPELQERGSPGPMLTRATSARASRPSNRGSNGIGRTAVHVPKQRGHGHSMASNESSGRATMALDQEEEGEPKDANDEYDPTLQENGSHGHAMQARVASARAPRSSSNRLNGTNLSAPNPQQNQLNVVHGPYGHSMSFNGESTNVSLPQRIHAHQSMALQNLPPMTFQSVAAGVPTMPGASQHVHDTTHMLNAVGHRMMLSQQQQAQQLQQAQLHQVHGMYPIGAMPWTNMLPSPFMFPQQPSQQQNQAPDNAEAPQPLSTEDDRKRSADVSSDNESSKRALLINDRGQPRSNRQESRRQHHPLHLAAQREKEGTKDAPLDVDNAVVVKMEENDGMPVFYSLLWRLRTSNQNEWSDLGFITAESRASLADLRHIIQSQFADELLNNWIFSLGPLGPVKLNQEFLQAEKLMKGGNGTAQNPFVLRIVVEE